MRRLTDNERTLTSGKRDATSRPSNRMLKKDHDLVRYLLMSDWYLPADACIYRQIQAYTRRCEHLTDQVRVGGKMQESANYIAVIAAIASGVFALIGAIAGNLVGQIINRGTQREAWLLKQRAEVFSKFWTDFEEYNNETARISEEYSNDSMSYGKYASAALGKLQITINIVCLYLPKNTRDEFRKKMKFLTNFTPELTHPITFESLKFANKPYLETEDEIRKVFENNLPIS